MSNFKAFSASASTISHVIIVGLLCPHTNDIIATVNGGYAVWDFCCFYEVWDDFWQCEPTTPLVEDAEQPQLLLPSVAADAEARQVAARSAKYEAAAALAAKARKAEVQQQPAVDEGQAAIDAANDALNEQERQACIYWGIVRRATNRHNITLEAILRRLYAPRKGSNNLLDGVGFNALIDCRVMQIMVDIIVANATILPKPKKEKSMSHNYAQTRADRKRRQRRNARRYNKRRTSQQRAAHRSAVENKYERYNARLAATAAAIAAQQHQDQLFEVERQQRLVALGVVTKTAKRLCASVSLPLTRAQKLAAAKHKLEQNRPVKRAKQPKRINTRPIWRRVAQPVLKTKALAGAIELKDILSLTVSPEMVARVISEQFIAAAQQQPRRAELGIIAQMQPDKENNKELDSSPLQETTMYEQLCDIVTAHGQKLVGLSFEKKETDLNNAYVQICYAAPLDYMFNNTHSQGCIWPYLDATTVDSTKSYEPIITAKGGEYSKASYGQAITRNKSGEMVTYKNVFNAIRTIVMGNGGITGWANSVFHSTHPKVNGAINGINHLLTYALRIGGKDTWAKGAESSPAPEIIKLRQQVWDHTMYDKLPADLFGTGEVDALYKQWLESNQINVHTPLASILKEGERQYIVQVAQVAEYVHVERGDAQQLRVVANAVTFFLVEEKELAKLFNANPEWISYDSNCYWPEFTKLVPIKGTKEFNTRHRAKKVVASTQLTLSQRLLKAAADKAKAAQRQALEAAKADTVKQSEVTVDKPEALVQQVAPAATVEVADISAPLPSDRPAIPLDIKLGDLAAEAKAYHEHCKKAVGAVNKAKDVDVQKYRGLEFCRTSLNLQAQTAPTHGFAAATMAYAFLSAVANGNAPNSVGWTIEHLMFSVLLMHESGAKIGPDSLSSVVYFKADGHKVTNPSEVGDAKRLDLFIQNKCMFSFLLDNGQVKMALTGEDNRGRAIHHSLAMGYENDKLVYYPVSSFANFMCFWMQGVMPLVANSIGDNMSINSNLVANITKAVEMMPLSKDEMELGDAGSQLVIGITFKPIVIKYFSPINKDGRWISLPSSAKTLLFMYENAPKQNKLDKKSIDDKDMMEAAIEPAMRDYGLDVRFTNAEFVAAGMGHVSVRLLKELCPKHFEMLKQYIEKHQKGEIDLDSIISLTSKAAKGMKRILLMFGQGAEPVDGVTAGWQLEGQPVQIKGSLSTLAVGTALAAPPGQGYCLDKKRMPRARVPKVAKIVKDCFDPANPLELNLHSLQGEVQWERSEQDGWVIYTPVNEIMVSFGDVLCHVNLPKDAPALLDTRVAHEEFDAGQLLELKYRVVTTVAGTSNLEIRYSYRWVESNGKLRSIIKGQVLMANRAMLFNSLNNVDGRDIGLLIPADCWKGDTHMTYAVLAANCAKFNIGNEHPDALRLLAECKRINDYYGKPNNLEDFVLYISPIGLVSGVYEPLIKMFADIYMNKEGLWVNWQDAAEQARIVYNIYHDKEGWSKVDSYLQHFPELQTVTNVSGVTLEVYADSNNYADKFTNVLVFVYGDGKLVGYLQRTHMLCSQPGLPLYNVEVYESSTVNEAVGSSQMRLPEAGGMKMAGVPASTLRDVIDDGVKDLMQLKAVASMVHGCALKPGMKVINLKCFVNGEDNESALDVVHVSAADWLIIEELRGTKGLDRVKLVGDFAQLCEIFKDVLFVFELAGGIKFTVWMPFLPAFNKLKSCNASDDNFVKKFYNFLKGLLTGTGGKGSDAKSIYYLMKGWLDSEDAITLLHGRKNNTAKRVAHPGLPIGRVGVVVSDEIGSEWQELKRDGIDVEAALRGEHIKVASNRAPLSGGYVGILQPIHHVKVMSDEGYLLDEYQYLQRLNGDAEGYDRRQFFMVSAYQIATDVLCPTCYDGGDFDGDGHYLTPLDEDAEVATFESAEANLKALIGQNIWKVDGEYFTDHYAINGTKKALKSLLYLPETIHSCIKPVAEYAAYQRGAVLVQHKAVGSAYVAYMMGAIGANISSTLLEHGMCPAPLEPIGKNIKVALFVAALYEAMLGGYSKAALKFARLLEHITKLEIFKENNGHLLTPEVAASTMHSMKTAPNAEVTERAEQCYWVLRLTGHYYRFNKGHDAPTISIIEDKDINLDDAFMWLRLFCTILDLQRGRFEGFFGWLRDRVERGDGEQESSEYSKWRGQAYSLAVTYRIIKKLEKDHPQVVQDNVYLYSLSVLFNHLEKELRFGYIDSWDDSHLAYFLPKEDDNNDPSGQGGSTKPNNPITPTDDGGEELEEEHGLIVIDKLDRSFIQAHPRAMFVFGDNLAKEGRGGQAKECRGEHNVIGIPTKKSPRLFFSNDDFNQAKVAIDVAFNDINTALANGQNVYFPVAGVGTGLAKLSEKAPKIWNYLVDKLVELGINSFTKVSEERALPSLEDCLHAGDLVKTIDTRNNDYVVTYELDGKVYSSAEVQMEENNFWMTDIYHPSMVESSGIGVTPVFAESKEAFPKQVVVGIQEGYHYAYVGNYKVVRLPQDLPAEQPAPAPVQPDSQLALLMELQAKYGDVPLSELIGKLSTPVAKVEEAPIVQQEVTAAQPLDLPEAKPVQVEPEPVVEEASAITTNEHGLNEEQLKVLNYTAEEGNLFLTGEGGAGKSFTVDAIRHYYNAQGWPYITTGSTGTAVVNIDADGTFNGIFGLLLGFEDEQVMGGFKKGDSQRSMSQYMAVVNKAMNAPRLKNMLGDLQSKSIRHNRPILIIADEASMLDSLLVSAVHEALTRKRLNIQWLLVGDPAQFKPVNGYMFYEDVKVYDRAKKEYVVIPSILNRADLDFAGFNLTKNMRAGKHLEWAQSLSQMRLGKGAGITLPGLVQERWEYSLENEAPEGALHLAYTNFTVQKYNQKATADLIASGAKNRTYQGRVNTRVQYGKTPDAWLWKYNQNDIRVTKFAPIDLEMTYCVGMRVMMRETNIYEGDKLLINNGAIGTVLALKASSVLVEFDNGVTYEVKQHTFTEGKNSFIQIPLVPAYSMTFSKCQGMTIDVPVVIHLYAELVNGEVIELKEENAAYVACSRLTNPDNLYFHTKFNVGEAVIRQLAINSYKCNRRSVEFLQSLQ